MREFLKSLEKDGGVVQINEILSKDLEISHVLKKYNKEAIIFNNIQESPMRVVSGICNTREKIAKSIGTDLQGIKHKVIEATENPIEITKTKSANQNFTYSGKPDLNELPILTHYKRDGGPYITAGVVIAKDPDTKVRNASIHRMLVIGKDRLTARIVPRNLYTYYKKAESLDKPLEIAIAIGLHPATLLACCTSVPITTDELEVSNSFHNGEMELNRCETVDLEVPDCEILLEGKIMPHERAEEGPFVDLTDTYDVIRQEPVINLERMHYKENPHYHAIMPAGNEHKLLQGLPQEPRIYQSVRNTVPTVKDVILTEGGCCWLHAAISIQKQTAGDGKNVIMAALSAHPSLKHCVVVDDDVDIYDPEDIEYAIATRVKGDDDILIVPKARGSSLDPCATPDGTTTKVGVDATKLLDKLEKFERVSRTKN
jgi:UbiD family decarboxylase